MRTPHFQKGPSLIALQTFFHTSAVFLSCCTVSQVFLFFFFFSDRIFSDGSPVPLTLMFRDQECFLIFLMLTLMGRGVICLGGRGITKMKLSISLWTPLLTKCWLVCRGRISGKLEVMMSCGKGGLWEPGCLFLIWSLTDPMHFPKSSSWQSAMVYNTHLTGQETELERPKLIQLTGSGPHKL